MPPVAFYEGVAAHLPNASVELIDAGHFFVLENPDSTTHAIASFLT